MLVLVEIIPTLLVFTIEERVKQTRLRMNSLIVLSRLYTVVIVLATEMLRELVKCPVSHCASSVRHCYLNDDVNLREIVWKSDTNYGATYGSTTILICSNERACHGDTEENKQIFHHWYADTTGS
jgi:hypothetical protein